MKKSFLYTIFVLLASIIFFMSCSQKDDTCRKNKNVKMNATFYIDSIKKGRPVAPKFSVDSLTVRGIGSDSLIYNNLKNIDAISLPLQVFNESSNFELKINNTIDTISIKHKNLVEFLSIECGSIRTYSIDTVFFTTHFIDSISIQQQKVNTIQVENLQIHHFNK